MLPVGRVLVVEDDEPLASALSTFALRHAGDVCIASTKACALGILASIRVDVLLLDLALPDGSGMDVLAKANAQRVYPHVIVISGSATASSAFELAQAGVRSFVDKPLSLAALEHVWDQALHDAPDLSPFVRACVGRRSLHEVEDSVRQEMTDEAMAVGRGSRRKASSLLGISRQLLQQILRGRQAVSRTRA